jgi:1-phosphofructokinase/tagatose 6-phosphate kinase
VIAVREMVGLGARAAIMTALDGCYALMGPEEPGGARCLYRVRMAAGSVEPRATVGSGDAFLAGFVASRYLGRSQLDCLAYAVACGAESTQHLGAGLVDPEQVGRLRSEIEVERPALPAEVG